LDRRRQLRAIPELAVSLDMREGELFGLAEEDLDLDGEKIVRVRQQVRKTGQSFAFARFSRTTESCRDSSKS
jgi:hypothetical protein